MWQQLFSDNSDSSTICDTKKVLKKTHCDKKYEEKKKIKKKKLLTAVTALTSQKLKKKKPCDKKVYIFCDSIDSCDKKKIQNFFNGRKRQKITT